MYYAGFDSVEGDRMKCVSTQIIYFQPVVMCTENVIPLRVHCSKFIKTSEMALPLWKCHPSWLT